MNKYFYDDICISIKLGRQSASTGRATSSNGHIWNRCLFSCSTSSCVSRLRTLLSLLTPTLPLNDDCQRSYTYNSSKRIIIKSLISYIHRHIIKPYINTYINSCNKHTDNDKIYSTRYFILRRCSTIQ